MASVRERQGRYYARYRDESGRRVERRLSAQGARAAREEASELERHARRIRRGLDVTCAPVTIRQAWERYRELAAGKASWASIEGRFRLHLLPALGDWYLHTVRPADVERLLAAKARAGLSPQTCEHLRVHLAALYSFCIRRERCFRGDNPALLAERPVIPERPTRFLEAEYVVRVVEAVPPRWRNFFALAVYTGLRAGELRGLRLDSVDTRRRVLLVWRSNRRDTTKGGRLRVVPVPAEAMPYLAAQLAEARAEWLFPARRGGQMRPDVKLARLLRTALKRVGLVQGYQHRCVGRGVREGCGFEERRATCVRAPCPHCGRLLWVTAVPLRLTFHSLRTTHGTHAYEATGDIRHVQRVLGHADVRTTERVYAGLRTARLLSQADRLSFAPHPLPTVIAVGVSGEEAGRAGQPAVPPNEGDKYDTH
jgi:integrase